MSGAGRPAAGMSIVLAAAALCGCKTLPQDASASTRSHPLAGAWTLVSATDVSGTRSLDFYGPSPKGRIMFDADGRYMLIVLRSDLPDYAPREAGTPEDNRRVVAGSISNYGTYRTVDGVLLLTIAGSSYRRWEVEHGSPPEGAKGPQRRPFALSGDTLTYIVDPSSSGGVAKFVWRREDKP